ncbi:MAG: thiamine diphosphokinase [bacterium]
MDKSVIIVGAGERICRKKLIKSFTRIISADGGFSHLKFVRNPMLIVGDFDSLSVKRVPKDIPILKYSKTKDETDIELAIEYSIKKKFSPIYITGVTGTRDDHFYTALSLLEKYKDNEIHILTENYDIFILREMRSYDFDFMEGSHISFFSVSPKTKNIESRGFEYEYTNTDLYRSKPIGVSNRITGKKANIKFEKGLIICFLKIC